MEDREFIIMIWTTEDDQEHHYVFNYDDMKRNIEEAEKMGRVLWQNSALIDNKNKKIKHMSIFRGHNIHWEIEEVPTVKRFQLVTEVFEMKEPLPPKEE